MACYYSSNSAATKCTACLSCTFSPTLGSVLCSTCATGKVSEPDSLACTSCYESQNQVPDDIREFCVEYGGDEKAVSGACVRVVSSSNAVHRVLSNDGTPFHVMAIISVHKRIYTSCKVH